MLELPVDERDTGWLQWPSFDRARERVGCGRREVFTTGMASMPAFDVRQLSGGKACTRGKSSAWQRCASAWCEQVSDFIWRSLV